MIQHPSSLTIRYSRFLSQHDITRNKYTGQNKHPHHQSSSHIYLYIYIWPEHMPQSLLTKIKAFLGTYKWIKSSSIHPPPGAETCHPWWRALWRDGWYHCSAQWCLYAQVAPDTRSTLETCQIRCLGENTTFFFFRGGEGPAWEIQVPKGEK